MLITQHNYITDTINNSTWQIIHTQRCKDTHNAQRHTYAYTGLLYWFQRHLDNSTSCLTSTKCTAMAAVIVMQTGGTKWKSHK